VESLKELHSDGLQPCVFIGQGPCPWQAFPAWSNVGEIGRAYRSEAPFRPPFFCWLLTLITNIKVGWKGLQGIGYKKG